MKVKFIGDKNNIYNADGLTAGSVYDVINISHDNRHLLKIMNDNNYIRYYHKNLFIEVYTDAEDNLLSFVSETNMESIDPTKHQDCVQILKELYETLDFCKSTCHIHDIVLPIIRAMKKYPELSMELITNYTDPRTYVHGIIVTNDILRNFANKKYKIGVSSDEPARVLRKSDTYLIGKKIYFFDDIRLEMCTGNQK